jgi:hypothetical protein
MIDGTGMCGGCRVVINQGAKFVCMDGPEFDGNQVDWNNLISRLSFYRAEEKEALERWTEHHCQLGLQPVIAEADKAALAFHDMVNTNSTEVDLNA